MKLVYQIPDKLYYIQQFLDYPSYKKLHYDVFRSKLLKLNTVKNTWQSVLLKNYKNSPNDTLLDPSYSVLKKMQVLLNTNPFIKINHDKIKFMLYSMEDSSGINWHDDGGHKYGITYYINRRWNHLFGGEFMFKLGQSKGFLPLVGNSIVIIKAPLEHKVAPVMNPLVPRKTIQIFIPKT